MIKSINKIENLGVFQNYNKPVGFKDFDLKNIIYGWNYSGKTTVSRVFSSIEHKSLHPDYMEAKFKIEKANGSFFNEQNIEQEDLNVKVFNSDFIEANLEWDGKEFDPILLLGEDSIEAKKVIDANEIIIQRCRDGYKAKDSSLKQYNSSVASLKKQEAKNIKQTLKLIEAFSATHLDIIKSSLTGDLSSYIIDKNDVDVILNKATSSDKDKLEPINQYNLTYKLDSYIDKANEYLKIKPEFSSTIEYLRDNPAVANWVESGLEVNEGKNKCEFCQSDLKESRMNDLRSHFSQDLKEYKDKLKVLINRQSLIKLEYNKLSPLDFYPEFRPLYDTISSEIEESIAAYNTKVDEVTELIQKKYDSPFEGFLNVEKTKSFQDGIENKIAKLNSLIESNNKKTTDFSSEKNSAITQLKNSFVAEFYLNSGISSETYKSELMEKHKTKYQDIENKIKSENSTLEASISKAHQGRKTINEYISGFLGRDEIQIDVVKTGDIERFQLVRDGNIAKNLSEGEKTAIAFSFFLSKLGEEQELDKLIIYIDDPISSLDSNHIFQVNAVIKNFFFRKETIEHGNDEWKLNCKQIFISTHNFEFFSLLKELPLNKRKSRFYQVKRLNRTESTFLNLPKSIHRYSSEYHYLFSVIHRFHTSDDKSDMEVLMSIPNVLRRFIELYTYSKIPSFSEVTVDQRAEILFGDFESKRILKVLHYFSHLNNIERLIKNSDLISDIENAVSEIMDHLKKDSLHYDALIESVQ
jgi:wobble nucleotide-excising tRNase